MSSWVCLALLQLPACAALRRFDVTTLSGRHDERVMSLAWRSDGTHVASAGFDGTVRIWDVAAGTVVHVLRTSSPHVVDVQWSADGARLASTSATAVEIFDAATGARVMAIETTIGPKQPPRWGPAAVFAVPTYDGRIVIDDAASGRAAITLHGHTAEISSLAWSPDRRTLLSGSWDGTVRSWDWAAGVETGVLEAAGAGDLEVGWSDSGRFASWHRSVVPDVTLYEVATGERTRVATGPVAAAAWKPDEDILAIGMAGGAVELRRAESDASHVRFTCGSFADTLAWSPDGRLLAAVPFMSGHLCLWDSAHAALVELHAASRPLIALAWSPDGSRLAVGGYDGKLRLLTFRR